MGNGKALTDSTLIRLNGGKVVTLKQKICRELITIISVEVFQPMEARGGTIADSNCDTCSVVIQDSKTHIISCNNLFGPVNYPFRFRVPLRV